MKKIVTFLLVLAVLSSFCVVGYSDSEAKTGELEFKNGEFKILHITDPQDDAHPAYDLINFIKLAIEETQPDLIVFTGDMVEDSRGADKGVDDEDTREGVCVNDENDELIYDKTLENTKIACDAVFSIVNDAKIPFVTAQGNNDHSCGIKNEDWLKIYADYEYCLTSDMSNDKDDRIDFNTVIMGSDGKPCFNIWCMDTGKKGVNNDQIKWYKEKSSELKEQNGGKVIPSFVFQHIFTSDIGNLMKPVPIWADGAMYKDLFFYRLNRDVATGNAVEVSETPGKTSKQFRAWKKQGDVLGAYFGHEHYEGYTGTYKGIELGLTYGCEFAKDGPYGVRVFTLYEDDIENYDNEILVYNGSVLTGDAEFAPLVQEELPVYATRAEKIQAYINNFKTNIVVFFNELFD